MDVDRKIWGAVAVVFFIGGVTALGDTALLVVSTLAALVLGLLMLVGCDFSKYLNPIRAFLAFRPYVNLCEGLGALLVIMLAGPLLYKDDAEFPLSLFVAMSAAYMSFFCLLMMLRPVRTNFWVLFALCYVQILGKFGDGWPKLAKMSLALSQ